MRVLVIHHHREDDAGFIGEAFERHGGILTTHLFPADGELPPVGDFQQVVVLGATWSIYDRDAVGAWIDAELDWLRQADAAEVPVFGICFGAQALTTALGGRVEKAPTMELGWVMIDPEPGAAIAPGPWFQFHSDRCLVPPTAHVLASNGIGVQAFTLGPHLGVQFHPEVDRTQLQGWLDHGGAAEVQAAGLEPQALLAETRDFEPAARLRAAGLVEWYLSLRRRGAAA